MHGFWESVTGGAGTAGTEADGLSHAGAGDVAETSFARDKAQQVYL